MHFEKYMRLLALAHKPETSKSVLDWCPFPGQDTLDTIITRHNQNCLRYYQELGWLPDDIEELVEGINIVPHDLSTVDQLHIPDFADINIILVAIDVIDESEMSKIDEVKARMGRHKHSYFLPQVSTKPGTESMKTYFRLLPIIPSTPEIIGDQRTFEGWLHLLYQYYYTAITSMPPPAGDRAIILGYSRTLRQVAAEVRDAAIMKGLGEEDTVTLARRAGEQALALARVERQVHAQTGRRVVFDAIRQPVVSMPIKPPVWRNSKVVALGLTHPMRELTTEQHIIVVDLGIKAGGSATVHLNQPTIRDKINRLRGVVEATTFTAQLPTGLGMRGGL